MCFTYWFESILTRTHWNISQSYLMLFPTNTPHVHIHVLGITAILLSPEILLLYQLSMNANGYPPQPILSQWASSIKNSLAERRTQGGQGNCPILPMKGPQHLPCRWQDHSCWSAKTLEHGGSNSPHSKPLPCHHLISWNDSC